MKASMLFDDSTASNFPHHLVYIRADGEHGDEAHADADRREARTGLYQREARANLHPHFGWDQMGRATGGPASSGGEGSCFEPIRTTCCGAVRGVSPISGSALGSA